MEKTLLVVAMLLAVAMFSSCTGYSSLNYKTLNETHVVLDKANFEVIGQAEGSWSAEYVLGFGGYKKETLKENAIQQMYKNANLKSSQAIINVNYSTSVRTVLGFYTEYTVTAYGTIIEFK